MGLGWHVISGEDFLYSLRRVESGEDSDLVYAELWANANHEWPAEKQESPPRRFWSWFNGEMQVPRFFVYGLGTGAVLTFLHWLVG